MRSIIQHLRFPFSYLLLPVFLMGHITTFPFVTGKASIILLLFFILHILVYPSSNAYNSLQDQDEGSVGLIKKPLPTDKNLIWISVIMDLVAVLLALFISIHTALYILIYIVASRLYSYRKVRLKKYPFLGFLVVFFFQGAWIYIITITALGDHFTFDHKAHIYFALAASCLIGAIYPLSQIYQHKQDKEDGVTTISYILGKKGTFIFSGALFLIGSISFVYPIFMIGDKLLPIVYLAFQLPSLIYFNYWFYKVIKDESEANFKHTMRMSLLSATCMNAFFLFMLIVN